MDKGWAVMDNADVSRFHELVPEMAHAYPFELDPFQKQVRRQIRQETGLRSHAAVRCGWERFRPAAHLCF